jgi:hypothetical protein
MQYVMGMLILNEETMHPLRCYMNRGVGLPSNEKLGARTLKRGEMVHVSHFAEIAGFPNFEGYGAVLVGSAIVPNTAVNVIEDEWEYINGHQYFVLAKPGTVIEGSAIALTLIASEPSTTNEPLETILKSLALSAEELNAKCRAQEKPGDEGLTNDLVFCWDGEHWSLVND